MSFIIAVHVNEGIVLASDRRTTYVNTLKQQGGTIVKNVGIHTTDSTDKTFLCSNKCGISTCGEATLQGKPITGYIQEFIRTKISSDTSVCDVPNMILEFFNDFSPSPSTNFIVAGYNSSNDGVQQVIYKVSVESSSIVKVDTSLQGAIWDGEVNTLLRLIKKNLAIKGSDGDYSDLVSEEILWNYFTLQDAVDFARYAVETTINTMHFKNVVETVGGKIDILVITPEKAEWLQKEKLR